MAITTESDYFSTQSKIFINLWPTLRRIISEISKYTKESVKNESDETPRTDSELTLLTDLQVDDAIHGPYHQFICKSLSAYATLAKVRMALNVKQDETLSSRLIENNIFEGKSEKKLKSMTLVEVDKIQNQLNTLVKQQFQQWDDLINEWKQDLTLVLSGYEIILSESEIDEFKRNEPISELNERFTEIGIPYPKLKNVIGFKDYLQLKCTIIIRSSLGRRHKPHTDADIQKIIKKAKKNFENIKSSEDALATNQFKEIDDTISSISFES